MLISWAWILGATENDVIVFLRNGVEYVSSYTVLYLESSWHPSIVESGSLCAVGLYHPKLVFRWSRRRAELWI
jgi:hypothetical protein